MARERLMPPNFQDLPFWNSFTKAIDAVWAGRIDDPQRVFPLLRDTYSFGYSPYAEPPISGLKDVTDFFVFSREPNSVILDVNVPGTTFTTSPINTGYPKNLILVYRDTGSGFEFIPMAQYTLMSGTQIQFSFTVNAGDKLKFVERIPAVEITNQLRFLGFQYQDTEFVTRPTYVDNSHVLQMLADNYSQYLKENKGTANFIDFFGFCFSSVFTVKQLWTNTSGLPAGYGPMEYQGSPAIGTPVVKGGTWFPTSHVNLYYDLFLYGNSIDEDGIRAFFNYIAPINLVLQDIVLNAQIQSEPIIYSMAGELRVSYL